MALVVRRIHMMARRRRWENERDVAKYVDLIEKEHSPIIERTDLSEEDARSESIFLGLRLMRGLDLEDYRRGSGPICKIDTQRILHRLLRCRINRDR